MKLILIRHAKAEERKKSDSVIDDFRRELTRAGIRRIERISPILHRLIGPIDCLITSPLKRALQTATLLHYQSWKSAKWFELESLAPDTNPKLFIQWLAKLALLKKKGDATIVVVGHEPHLSRLVGLLTTGKATATVVLQKSAMCVLEFKMPGMGDGKIIGLFQPRDLRRISHPKA